MYTEAQNKATQKYLKKTTDQLAIRLPKGKKQVYIDYAKSVGKSLTKWITDTLDSAMSENRD